MNILWSRNSEGGVPTEGAVISMAAGRPKKPTVLSMVRGNPGKRPPNKDEPKPELSIPECPDMLGDDAREEWLRVAPMLFKLGLLSDIYRSALMAYCVAYGRWIDAEKNIQKYGALVMSPNGFPMKSAALTISDKAMDQMLRAAREFGMTPSSMSGVTATKKETASAWDKQGRA